MRRQMGGIALYDVIVIGARCAGAPTAMLLARKGYRVLLVDRASFPSDTLSTHYIHQPGVERLAAWGLLDRLAATGCPPLTRGTIDLGEVRLDGAAPPCGDIAAAYAPRRSVLDAILVEAAVSAGAELREGFSFRMPLIDDMGVAGIRAVAATGAMVSERARLVVGADGRNSLLAHYVNAPRYHDRPTLTCAYYSYWSGVALASPALYMRDGVAAVAFPTNHALTCVVVIRPFSDFEACRRNSDAMFMAGLDAVPALGERVRAGRREERYVGTADLPNFFRKPFGKGWILVGDAGYHKDPLTGQGITDAFIDAQRAAEAIDAGLSGRSTLDAALLDYERRRDRERLPIYDFTCRLAALTTPEPDMRRLYHALAGSQSDADRLFGVLAGTVPVTEFFAEDNVARIIAAAPPRPAA